MKKTLAALAVLGAFAGGAMAANVTLYGIVDEGLVYTHLDDDVNDSTDNFGLQSGIQSGSRWGIKGVEELGNGMNVGFTLESGFGADDGTSLQDDRLFGREARLFVNGSWGELAAGRMGSPMSGNGTYGLYGITSAFGTSFGNYVAQAGATFTGGDRQDNALVYKTPTFAGFTGYVMYSFKSSDRDSDGNAITTGEGHSDSDRYAALAFTYANGPFTALLGGDWRDYAATPNGPEDYDDGYSIILGGNYDFGPAKLFLAAQYFDEVKASSFTSMANNNDAWHVLVDPKTTFGDPKTTFGAGAKLNGWSANLSVSAPLAGGTFLAGIGYVDAESADSTEEHYDTSFDFTRILGSVGYAYPFSKRTNMYVAASYGQDKIDPDNDNSYKPTYGVFTVGLRHKF
jgi:predicted porin